MQKSGCALRTVLPLPIALLLRLLRRQPTAARSSRRYFVAVDVGLQPSLALRGKIDAHRSELDAVMRRYGATNPRLFGSVARGDTTQSSDIDILVDLDPAEGNILFRAGGLSDEFRRILGQNVDVFTTGLLKGEVSATALADAVAL